MGVQEASGGRLSELFDASPEFEAHTSMSAELALLLGLAALLASPFSVTFALSAGLAALAFCSALVGLATTSRRDRTGGLLAPLGLLFSLVAFTVLGLRYLGVDTAFGDALMPRLLAGLEYLNSLLPIP
jgi:hypothetical protein